MKSIVLIDTDLSQDHRVLKSIYRYGDSVEIIDIRSMYNLPLGWLGWWHYIWVLLQGFSGFSNLKNIYNLMGYQRLLKEPFGRGLRSYLKWFSLSIRTAHYIKYKYKSCSSIRFHAHDLYCAFVVSMLPKNLVSNFVYDSHEFQIHRNRKAGLLRILFESFLERKIVSLATEIRVVNYALAQAMINLYGKPLESRLCVVYNDNYEQRVIPSTLAQDVAIVYVGKGTLGRQLEKLTSAEIRKNQIHCLMYFLGDKPRGLDGFNSWSVFSQDYESDLREKMKTYRCLMWCCLDSYSFSYKYATPNKFFQALALGIPIIASEGTYLANIVNHYSLGYVLENNELECLIKVAKSVQYEQWLKNIEIFRNQLNKREIKI